MAHKDFCTLCSFVLRVPTLPRLTLSNHVSGVMCAVVKRETCFHSLRALVIEKNHLSMNHELTRIVMLLVIKIIGMPNAITNCQTLTVIELRMLVAG